VILLHLSDYWKADLDVVGCRWNDLDPSLRWPVEIAVLSGRDSHSGSFADMIVKYEALSASLAKPATASRA
jgi:dTDP-4-dehydrorhamnose 3,5-epimerase